MALVVKDRVKETTATTGTGTLTLAGAVTGFQSFNSALSNADTTYYAIFESSTGAWEVGLGTFTSSGTTLSRDTILESSNAGSAINLTAGAADVFITQPAEKAVYLDANGYIFTSDGRNLTNLNASNISSGTIGDAYLPASISSDITGNAATATKWATGRTISLTGDVTGTSAAFDGSGNLSFATTIAANSVALGTDTTGNYVATGAVSGNGLSGSASAESATFTVTSNATNANTPSTIVFRDASGNFSAGTITAALSGNASTATKWATGRTLTLTGDVTGTSAAFDGSGNISIATTVAANSVALGTDTTGNYVAAGATSGNGISGSVSSEGGTFTVTSNATNANTASTIVFRDASGNFSAGTITANLTGTASSATNADTVDSLHASQFLRSDAADSTASTISFTGDIEVGDQILHNGDTDTYMQFHAANQWRVVTGGVERIEASSSGIRIDDAFTLPTTDGTSGQVLTTNGSGVVTWASAGGASDYQEFTSSGTYTKPSGVNYIYVEGVGGGGGGAVGNFAGDGAGGGGGGAFVAKLFRAADVGSTETVTIGAGGAGSGSGGGDGTDGGDSTFGSLLTAKGGQKGIRNNTVNRLDPYQPFTNSDGGALTTPSYCGLGGIANANGGNTIYGGGGGAGAKTVSGTGGTSVYGGAGGDSAIGSAASNGVQPGGGGGAVDGGAAAGSGAAGRIRVWAW